MTPARGTTAPPGTPPDGASGRMAPNPAPQGRGRLGDLWVRGVKIGYGAHASKILIMGAPMPAKYVLNQSAKGFHWNLLATNGRVIATSEVYNTRQAALGGIRSVQKNGATDVVVTAEEPEAARQPKASRAGASPTTAAAKSSARARKATAR